MPAEHLLGMAWFVGIGILAKVACLVVCRLHYQSWRHVSFRDLIRVAKAVALVGAFELAAGLAIHAQMPLPRSVLPLTALLGAVGLFGVRAARRLHVTTMKRRSLPRADVAGRRALVVGAGEAGHLVVREMLRHPESGLFPVAIVDDDLAKRRLTIEGVRVVGALDDIPRLLRACAADQVIMAIGSADGALMRRVKTLVAETNPAMAVQVVPGV